MKNRWWRLGNLELVIETKLHEDCLYGLNCSAASFGAEGQWVLVLGSTSSSLAFHFITLAGKLLLLLPSSLLLPLEAGRALSTWQGCLSIISEEGEISGKDTLKVYSCSSASPQILEDGVSEMEQTSFRRVPRSSSSNMTGNDQMPVADGNFRSIKALEATNAAQFSMLLKNLDALEETFANSDVLKLVKEILLQLGRLGALQLFDACLSRTLTSSSFFYLSGIPTLPIEEHKMDKKVDNDRGKIIVRSGKRKERRSRKRALANVRVSSDSFPPKSTWEGSKHPTASSAKRASKYRKSRLTIAKNEAEISTGVKVIANLERIKATLQKETGTVATLSCWAAGAGVH